MRSWFRGLLGIGIALVPSIVQSQVLVNGSFASAAIDFSGDVDSFTFNASIGDSIVLHKVGGLNAGELWDTRLELYDPSDVLVLQPTPARIITFVEYRALSSGEYTVLASDGSSAGTWTGTYQIHLSKVPGAFTVPDFDHGGPLVNGGSTTGLIFPGDIDMWEFGAALDSEISLQIEDVGGSALTPRVRLYDPHGMQVLDDQIVQDDEVLSLNHTAVIPGRYVVIISDGGTQPANQGEYELTYSSTGHLPAYFVQENVPIHWAYSILLVFTFLGITRGVRRQR